MNILSLASVSLGTLVSFGLPKVKRTIYFHAKEETSNKEEPIEKHTISAIDNENTIKKALVILGYNFKTSFSQGSVFRWSLWWALGMCGNYQVCIKKIYFTHFAAHHMVSRISNPEFRTNQSSQIHSDWQ